MRERERERDTSFPSRLSSASVSTGDVNGKGKHQGTQQAMIVAPLVDSLVIDLSNSWSLNYTPSYEVFNGTAVR